MTDRIDQLDERARWFREHLDTHELADLAAGYEAGQKHAEAAIARVRDATTILEDDAKAARRAGYEQAAYALEGAVLRITAALSQPAPAATQAAGQPEPATITDPEWLKQQYTAVIRRWWDADDNGAEEIADAVIRVRDRHLQQLRQRLTLADHAHRQEQQRADQTEDLLSIAHDTSNKSETERARAVQRADRLAALAREILYSQQITGDRITRWRATLDELTEHSGHATGPTVAEAAAADRRWWGSEKTGERP